jgi:hypothetical protein
MVGSGDPMIRFDIASSSGLFAFICAHLRPSALILPSPAARLLSTIRRPVPSHVRGNDIFMAQRVVPHPKQVLGAGLLAAVRKPAGS